jgi:hypothetical protein
MKFALVLMLSFSAMAFADDTTKILESSVVKSLGQLLNEKHQGQCVLPTAASDIRWMCMGALAPITIPQITVSRCAFVVEITCPTEKAVIFGDRSSHFVQFPREMERIEITPSNTMISFTSISIK